jgi:hypothetical protein
MVIIIIIIIIYHPMWGIYNYTPQKARSYDI